MTTMTTMKVLFLNPPSYENFDGGAGSRYQAQREIRSFWYPTWLCYPAGMIPGGRVIDAPVEGYTVEQTLAMAKDYDMVVLYTSTPSLKNDAKIAEQIKAQKPSVIIGFVGPHPTVLPEETLKTSWAVDFVAHKEFDYTVKEIAEGRDFKDVPGISYRLDGKIHHNAQRQPIEDLDALPFVAPIYKRDLNYEKYFIGYLQHPYVSIYSGRGCPSRCTFCLWPQTFSGHTYRTRSVENTMEELTWLVKNFPDVKEVFFDDDTFTANLPRARELAKRIKSLNITWSCNSRANVDYETLKIMKDSGLRLLLVGYESGNNKILHNIKKGVTVEQAKRFTKNCKEIGITIHGTFIVGLPGETRETIQDSIKFAREIDPDTIQVSLASPYPGTAFYDFLMDNSYFSPSSLVSENGFQTCAVEYPEISSEEIFKSLEEFYRKFYFRPKFIARILKKMLRDPEERRRRLREGVEFFHFLYKRREFAKSATH